MHQLGQLKRKTKANDDIDEKGDTDEISEYFAPSNWTHYWAGSLEKVELMRKRLESGEHLHHAHDCKQIIVDEKDRISHTENLKFHKTTQRKQIKLAQYEKLRIEFEEDTRCVNHC